MTKHKNEEEDYKVTKKNAFKDHRQTHFSLFNSFKTLKPKKERNPVPVIYKNLPENSLPVKSLPGISKNNLNPKREMVVVEKNNISTLHSSNFSSNEQVE